MKEIKQIENPIATDTWVYREKDGTIVSSRIMVGQPTEIPDDPDIEYIAADGTSG